MKNITVALCKMQSQIEQPKKDKIGFHKNYYADLASVINCIRKPFFENGLSYTQIATCTSDSVTVITTIYHVSGEQIIGSTSLPAKNIDPQKAGASITYARRYSLCAMAGVCGEDDDDGALASGLTDNKKKQSFQKSESIEQKNNIDHLKFFVNEELKKLEMDVETKKAIWNIFIKRYNSSSDKGKLLESVIENYINDKMKEQNND